MLHGYTGAKVELLQDDGTMAARLIAKVGADRSPRRLVSSIDVQGLSAALKATAIARPEVLPAICVRCDVVCLPPPLWHMRDT